MWESQTSLYPECFYFFLLSLSLLWTFNYLSWHDECLAIKSQVHLENYWTDLGCFAWRYLPQVGIRTNQPESSPSPGPGFLSLILRPCPFKVSEVCLIYLEPFVSGLSELQFVFSVRLGCWHLNSDFQGSSDQCFLLYVFDPLLQPWLWPGWAGASGGYPFNCNLSSFEHGLLFAITIRFSFAH